MCFVLQHNTFGVICFCFRLVTTAVPLSKSLFVADSCLYFLFWGSLFQICPGTKLPFTILSGKINTQHKCQLLGTEATYVNIRICHFNILFCMTYSTYLRHRGLLSYIRPSFVMIYNISCTQLLYSNGNTIIISATKGLHTCRCDQIITQWATRYGIICCWLMFTCHWLVITNYIQYIKYIL